MATLKPCARTWRTSSAEIRERFGIMKWADATFEDFHVHPPGTGIMHTINLEQLACGVATAEHAGEDWVFPDTMIGTDSHTPMVNGIGVLAWGGGGTGGGKRNAWRSVGDRPSRCRGCSADRQAPQRRHRDRSRAHYNRIIAQH